MNRPKFAQGAYLLLLLSIASCSTDSPTAGTPLSQTSNARIELSGALPSGTGVPGATSHVTYNTPSAQEADEQFNCTNVQHVQARFYRLAM